ncbi:hypothetical protein RB195_025421 [Necator americanus]|uniref:SRCR domain-containing protein n=1 Tax=Necator americanus TaxID=51031 RepID=A0ABR1ESE3_NECAM
MCVCEKLLFDDSEMRDEAGGCILNKNSNGNVLKENFVVKDSAELVCKAIGGVRHGGWQLVDDITPRDWMSSMYNEKWAVSCSVVYVCVIGKDDRLEKV